MLRLFAFLALLVPAPVAAQWLSGTVRVVDGDTLRLSGVAEAVRLLAIDAPEDGQGCVDPSGGRFGCGDWASAEARRLIDGRPARCLSEARDRYDRHLARCWVGGEDVGAMFVRRGLALTYRDDPTYEEQEKEAIFAGRGVWAYEMDDPAVHRAARRGEAPAPEGCAIKGNRSAGGRIYHLPGQRDYDRTRIDERRGERWFCTEAEARAAGWRRAMR